MKVYCVICEKPIRGRTKMVRMSMTMEPIRDDDPTTEDMGWYEIGPDCARKVAKALGEPLKQDWRQG